MSVRAYQLGCDAAGLPRDLALGNGLDMPPRVPERPILYLIRGLPGSGKTTLAKALVSPSLLSPKYYFEADDFFMNSEGEYHYYPSYISDAHAQCKERVEHAMRRENPQSLYASRASLAVSNTFARKWEMEHYENLAMLYDYQVRIISLFDNGLDDGILAARNVHGVPQAVIAKMRARWER